MEQQYQKEINIGKMLKTLGKRWLAIVLSAVITLVVVGTTTFLTTFKNKVYGVDLDFYFYQIPITDKEGNAIIGTATEYDENTMNMIYQNINSQSFIESIFCERGIPKLEGETNEELIEAINLANEKVDALDAERMVLKQKASELAIAKKKTITAKSIFDIEQLDYNSILEEYKSVLQASDTIGSTIDVAALKSALDTQKARYSTAKTNYDGAINKEIDTQEEYQTCQQNIINLSREIREAKDEAMTLKRKQDSFRKEVKEATKAINISYVQGESSVKSIIRVSIAVDNSVADSEIFANKLSDMIKTEISGFIAEKVDYETTYCDLINVLDEVEQINENEVIVKTATFGISAAFIVALIVCAVYLIKYKQEYIVLVPYDKENL